MGGDGMKVAVDQTRHQCAAAHVDANDILQRDRTVVDLADAIPLNDNRLTFGWCRIHTVKY